MKANILFLIKKLSAKLLALMLISIFSSYFIGKNYLYAQLTIDTTIIGNILCAGDCNSYAAIIASGGSPPYSYLWSDGQTDSTATNLCAGPYSVTVTDTSLDTASANITLSEPLELAITTSPDVTICIGQDAELTVQVIPGTGTPPYSFYWSNFLTESAIEVSPFENTTYLVYATDINGCSSDTASVYVNVYPPLNITLSTYDDSICSGYPAQIDAIVSGGDGAPYLITNLTDDIVVSPPFTVYPQVNTYYEISVNDFCTTPVATDTILITVLPSPTIDMYANPLEGCQPLTVQFLEASPNQGQTYLWDFGDDVFNISYQKNPEHTFVNDGSYDITLTVTSAFGCSNTLINSNMIEVYQKPTAEFTYTTDNMTVSFNNLSTNDSIVHWYFGDGDSLSLTIPGHTDHTYSSSGNYTVCLIAESKNGCKDTACLDVLITGASVINIESESYVNIYPNPTNNYTRIDYQLPAGVNKGEIVFYDTKGNEVKRFIVDRTFAHIRISTSELSSGTYFYNLKTEKGVVGGKKMVVIR